MPCWVGVGFAGLISTVLVGAMVTVVVGVGGVVGLGRLDVVVGLGGMDDGAD